MKIEKSGPLGKTLRKDQGATSTSYSLKGMQDEQTRRV